MAFEPSARHTVASLRASRGKRRYAMLRVETLDEAAAAAEAAGVELLSVPPAMVMDRRFREVAPNAFVFPVTISTRLARPRISSAGPFR
jgi:3-methyl-2-oxobutanoate hydroxymethyltransferase